MVCVARLFCITSSAGTRGPLASNAVAIRMQGLSIFSVTAYVRPARWRHGRRSLCFMARRNGMKC
jgi:hypothetical protein